MSTSEVYVNRLFEHAEHIFKLGFDEKGECSALAYSKRLHDRTNYVKQQMLNLGMEVRYDAVGNLFGLYKGKSPEKILVLSHVDTVFNAGRYDGVLGIILPLELLRFLKDEEIELQHSLEIMVCMGEESPGVTATFGSKLVTGYYSFSDLKKMTLAYDKTITVDKAIERYFCDYDQQPDFKFSEQELTASQLDPTAYKVALEVHIEQFLLLQNLAKNDNAKPYVGVMRGVGGHIRQLTHVEDWSFIPSEIPNKKSGLQVYFSGEASHSGATPMGDYRNDALLKASQFVLELFTSEWVKNGWLSFSNFEILHPASTSVPYSVVLEVNLNPEKIDEFKQHVSTESQASELIEMEEVKPRVSSKLVHKMAEIGTCVNTSALNALPEDEVRATVTQLWFEATNKATCFIDVRGASHSGMEKVVQNVAALETSERLKTQTEVISKKQASIFSEKLTKEVESVLKERFEGRVMKGSISVPGQDIGVLSSHGIPSSLLFIESGTGHHPDEYVREEAMLQAFEATKTLILHWDKN